MARTIVVSDDSDSDDGPHFIQANETVNDVDASDDDASHESDDSEPAGVFVDQEASESGTRSGSDSEQESESEDDFDYAAYAISGSGYYYGRDHRDFPQFARLPIELRRRIWTFFCPDLDASHRIIPVRIVYASPPNQMDFALLDDWELHSLSAPARRMLATHHESRTMALTKFPDMLEVNYSYHSGSGVLRFCKERDIVCVKGVEFYSEYNSLIRQCRYQPLGRLAESVANISLNLEGNSRSYIDVMLSFPNLKNVYGCLSVGETNTEPHYDCWCATDHAATAYVSYSEISPGLGENFDVTYAWHRPDVPCDDVNLEPLPGVPCSYLSETTGSLHLLVNTIKELSEPLYSSSELERLRKLTILPMREFWGEHGPEYYDKMRGALRKPDGTYDTQAVYELFNGDSDEEKDEDGSSAASGTDMDEYESEGIDDATVPEPETEDEDEDDLGVEIGDDTLAMELLSGSPAQGRGFSPLQDEDEDEDAVGNNHHTPLIIDDSDSEPGEGGARLVSPSKRNGARRVVLDDSDEDVVDDEPIPVRGTKRRRVVSSDDDSDVQVGDAPSRRKKHRSVVDDDEEDSDVQDVRAHARGPKSQAPVVLSDSDDEEDEEESDDEDQGRPLSLAEKLGVHRQANPVSSASEGDGSDSDDEEEDAEGDPRLGGYIDDYDDDEVEEEDDVDVMASALAEERSEDASEDEDVYYRRG